MNLFGFSLTKAKKKPVLPAGTVAVGAPGAVGFIREPYTGAWQKNQSLTTRDGMLASSAVFACVDLISSDVSKLRIKYVKLSDGVWQESTAPRFTNVLRKPNHYQTRAQFIKAWVASKLNWGNTYVLLSRNSMGAIVSMDVLNPKWVIPKVAPDGSIFYQVTMSPLMVTPLETVDIPARDIIHDRGITSWHPLVGMSPITACAGSAVLANAVTNNSAAFFGNAARPSAFVSSQGAISDATAARIKQSIEDSYSGALNGKVMVAGDGLTYTSMSMTGADAQLVEQLQWTVADVARCFHVPLQKIGADAGARPANSASIYESIYYSDCLQAYLENIELLLDDSFAVPDGAGLRFDTSGLMRMDEASMVTSNAQSVGAGIMTPNEGRARQGLGPKEGGDTPYLQAQWVPLSQLTKRQNAAAGAGGTDTPDGGSIDPPDGSDTPPADNDNDEEDDNQ